MTRDEFNELLTPRDLPDQDRMLRDVFDSVSAERARAESSGQTPAREDSAERLGFSDSAFRPISGTPARRWLTVASAAAMAIVVGGIGWSVVIQSPLAVQPGGQPATTVPPAQSPSPTPTSKATPTPTAEVLSVRPPSVRVVEQRAAGQSLFVIYQVCSGSGVARVTGPFGSRNTHVELPPGTPPRMPVNDTIGPDQCILHGEAFARPDGPVSGRLDVRFTFEVGTPEKQFNAYYGDVYAG